MKARIKLQAHRHLLHPRHQVLRMSVLIHRRFHKEHAQVPTRT